MPSALSWLDSSSASRRKAMEVIKLFEEKGTVDEIGIGSVRDALSDSLFPGTSVLHTRARYLFFIPWIYQYLESKATPSSAIVKEGRRLEIGLIETLLEGEDTAGTIGRMARQRLKNLPSALYWSGLSVWGLKLSDLSQDQYHRSLDRFYALRNGIQRDEDGQSLDAARRRNWHASLPAAPAGFPKCPVTFALTRAEAEYLRERLLTQCRGTLLTHLVDHCGPSEETAFVWEHPESGSFPAAAADRMEHARNFSEAINGAALLYNLMLAEHGVKNGMERLKERVEEHTAAFTTWASLMVGRSAVHREWSRPEFWKLVGGINPRIPGPTRSFVDAWLDLALASDPISLLENAKARRLITDRERMIKGRLARLHFVEVLRRWGGSSGAGQLSYRWNPQVSRVVADIQRGLSADA